jgi:pyruvate kinase
MAQAAQQFSHIVPSLPVPVVLAGQVLEHMTAHPTPTRAEVCNLYDALQAGTLPA